MSTVAELEKFRRAARERRQLLSALPALRDALALRANVARRTADELEKREEPDAAKRAAMLAVAAQLRKLADGDAQNVARLSGQLK